MFGFIKFATAFLFPEEFHVKDPSLWHVKFYLYWRRRGGKNKEESRENWCHYWRVVLLHAPRRWVFERKILWGTTFPVFVIGFFSYPFVVNRFFLESDSESVVSNLVLGLVILLLWVTFVFVGRGVGRLLEGAQSLLRERGYRIDTWTGVYLPNVVGVLFWLCTLALLVWVGIRWPIQFGLAAGSLLGLVLVVVAIVLAREWWLDQRSRRHPFAPQYFEQSGISQVLNNLSGTVQFVGQFVITRKRKRCPYAEFDFNVEELLKKQVPATQE